MTNEPDDAQPLVMSTREDALHAATGPIWQEVDRLTAENAELRAQIEQLEREKALRAMRLELGLPETARGLSRASQDSPDDVSGLGTNNEG